MGRMRAGAGARAGGRAVGGAAAAPVGLARSRTRGRRHREGKRTMEKETERERNDEEEPRAGDVFGGEIREERRWTRRRSPRGRTGGKGIFFPRGMKPLSKGINDSF